MPQARPQPRRGRAAASSCVAQGGGYRLGGRAQGRAQAADEADRQRPLQARPQHVGRTLERERELARSDEHTSELQSLMRISYAVFCLKQKKCLEHMYITTPLQTHHTMHK